MLQCDTTLSAARHNQGSKCSTVREFGTGVRLSLARPASPARLRPFRGCDDFQPGRIWPNGAFRSGKYVFRGPVMDAGFFRWRRRLRGLPSRGLGWLLSFSITGRSCFGGIRRSRNCPLRMCLMSMARNRAAIGASVAYVVRSRCILAELRGDVIGQDGSVWEWIKPPADNGRN
jgi:hypothetical protein